MNTLQLIARAVGEKIALLYTRFKTHADEKNIHRTSAEIRAEITGADIPAEIARAEDMLRQLAGKVDKAPGKELMPSPGAQPRENRFLNEQGEYLRIEDGSVVLDIQENPGAHTFAVSREQLGEYVQRAIIGGEPGLNVYFKHQNRPFSYEYYKVTHITFEYTTYWLTAYINRQSEDTAEKDLTRQFIYSFIYDDTQPEPLLLQKGVIIDSPYYISDYIDRALGGKAEARTVQVHLDNTAIHRTSAEIRAEIVDADIPPSIARGEEIDAKILRHNDAGNAHPGLRNSVAHLENGTTPAGRAEYAQKLGDANGNYTKTQLDTRLNTLIQSVAYDSATAKFTFTYADGRSAEIDTPLENTVKDGRYDAATAQLVLVLVSGQEIRIPAAGLTKIYTGKPTATATTAVSSSGEISTDIRAGAVDTLHLSATLLEAINSHLTLTGDTRHNIATFADQPARANLASGDKHSVMFGKIKRWFSDLGALAFLNKVGKTDMDTALQAEINGKEPVLAKNTAFNKNFGAVAGTVCQGNDVRLSDARPAKGGNAETVDGKHAGDFHLKDDNINIQYSDVLGGRWIEQKILDYKTVGLHFNRSIAAGVWSQLDIYTRGEDGYQKRMEVSEAKVQIAGSLILEGDSNKNVLFFNRNGVKKGYVGIGVDLNTDVYLYNYTGSNHIRIADGGKNYSNNKEIATVDQIPTDFSQLGDAASVTVEPNTAIRKTVVCAVKAGQGFKSRVALGLTNPGLLFSPAILSVGVNDAGTSFVDYVFGTSGRISSPAGTFALTSEIKMLSGGAAVTAGQYVAGIAVNDHAITVTKAALPTSLPANGGIAARLYQGGNTNSAQMVFNWSGQPEQPTWLWGGTDGTNMYVYNPANFSVTNSANLGGVAAGNFARRDVANTFAAYCDFRGGAGNTGSDMRFKKHIAPVENILPHLLALGIIHYTWAKEGECQRDTFGLSATQLQEKGGVFGKIVHQRDDEEKTKWVEYDRVGVLALKGLQEMSRKTEDENALIRREINNLRQEIATLREYIQSLKNMILR